MPPLATSARRYLMRSNKKRSKTFSNLVCQAQNVLEALSPTIRVVSQVGIVDHRGMLVLQGHKILIYGRVVGLLNNLAIGGV